MKTKLNENYSRPGKPLKKKAFEAMVKEAEKGPFYSIEESKKKFQKWREKKFRSAVSKIK